MIAVDDDMIETMEFSLNGVKVSLNSGNLVNSENLRNH